MTLNAIKGSIANGDTDSAIINFLDLAQSQFKEYENDVILLSGKFQNWKKEMILGIGKNKQKEWSRINYSIMQLISLIEYADKKESKNKSEAPVGFILVRYWSNKKWKDDYTINDEENENIQELSELVQFRKYIVKYSHGANLRAYLPPKEGYSNRLIKETKLICNLAQGTKIEIVEPVYQFSQNDYWAKVIVI